MRTAIVVAWPKDRVSKGKPVKPDLLFCDRLVDASAAFKGCVAKKIEVELWESGLGITRRRTGGTGRLNTKQGPKFEAGYKKALEQKPSTTITAPVPAAPPAKAAEIAAETLSAEEQTELDAQGGAGAAS